MLRLILNCALLIFSTSAFAQALSYIEDGQTLTISGSIDPARDTRTLLQKLRGKEFLVLRKIDPVDHVTAYNVGLAIATAKVTTVMDGPCDNKCVPVFLGGQRRVYGARAGQELGVATLTGTTSPNHTGASYNFFSKRLPALSTRLQLRIVSWGGGKRGLVFLPPDAANPKGSVLECEDAPARFNCSTREDLNSLTLGFVTSLEPVLLDGNIASAVAPASSANISVVIGAVPPATATGAKELTLRTVLTAKEVSLADGPAGIGSSFNMEGRIFAYASFAWGVDSPSGTHTFETRWFREQDLVHRSPAQSVSWNNSPGAAWYAVRAAELGEGNYRMEIWLDNKLAGSKSFSIKQ